MIASIWSMMSVAVRGGMDMGPESQRENSADKEISFEMCHNVKIT